MWSQRISRQLELGAYWWGAKKVKYIFFHCSMSSVVVLGAGIVGLSTALRLLQQNPELKVALVSDKFDQDTTSYGAAGIFRPTVELIKGVPQDVLMWVQSTLLFFLNNMMTSSNGKIFRVTGPLWGESTDRPHKSQWHGALMFSFICAWTNVEHRYASDLRRHGAHYDVTVRNSQ